MDMARIPKYFRTIILAARQSGRAGRRKKIFRKPFNISRTKKSGIKISPLSDS